MNHGETVSSSYPFLLLPPAAFPFIKTTKNQVTCRGEQFSCSSFLLVLLVAVSSLPFLDHIFFTSIPKNLPISKNPSFIFNLVHRLLISWNPCFIVHGTSPAPPQSHLAIIALSYKSGTEATEPLIQMHEPAPRSY